MTAVWKKTALGRLGRIVTGKTPSSEKPEDFGDAYPFMTPSDISGIAKRTETERFLSEQGATGLKGSLLPEKAVCVVCIGATIGKVTMTDRPSFSNQQINSIVPHAGQHDPDFVFYLCRLLPATLLSFAGGAATPIINKSTFSSIEVPVPDYKEQRKIAAVLSAYDDLIANNQRRIALLESMAEEIYREWFVRMRFPGAKPETFEKGLPPGWKHELIGGAFKFFGGATPSKDVARYWTNGDVNWFTPTDITAADGIYLESSRDRCTEDGLADCSANLFPAYSVMMTSRATIGAIGINTEPACTNQGFITCIPNEQYPLTYLYHWLKLAKPHFEMLSGGATFAELTKGTFKRIRILTPDIALVGRYEKLTRPMFDEMESLQKANGKLQSTRDALLPRLISGKLRVDQLNIQTPPSMRADTAPAV